MFQKLVKFIKLKLFFHSPFLMCLAIAALLYFGDYLSESVFLILLVLYYFMRYVWRRYLKKSGQFDESRIGTVNILLAVGFVFIIIYGMVTPESLKLTKYHPHHPSSENYRAKGSVIDRFSDSLGRKIEQRIVCSYLQQESLITQCSVMSSVELDNNKNTVEFFILDKGIAECEENSCTLFLAQASVDQIAQVTERKKNKDDPIILDGHLLNVWQSIKAPIKISATQLGDWYTFEMLIDNERTTWAYDAITNKYDRTTSTTQ